MRFVTLRAGLIVATVLSGAGCGLAAPPAAPKVGEEAKEFELPVLGGEKGDAAKLSTLAGQGKVVLVVLRGYPGYQCPLCTRQFGDFLAKADDFKAAKAHVVFVYPGPSDRLANHAADFVKGKDYPAHFTVLLDPDYAFTNAYGLRWDAKNETAYPATFVIDPKRVVRLAKVSSTHGDRSSAAEILKALAAE